MSEAFLKIVNMSISASWLVLAVLALRLVLKKAPKWVNVLLWGIVAVRLICPVSIESILSLIPSAETVSPDIMMDWTPEVSTGIPAVDTVVNPVITETFAPQPAASANPLQILIPVSANLWLLGILVMLGYTAVSYFLLRRKVATAVRLRDNIYQSENVASPFVLGIVRPKIYLPFRIDGGNLSHVIAHEEAHIRRKDHWWKPFGFVLLALHWFNPLMWIGYILLSRDIELACDEKVIKEMNNETKADYMEALVACSVNRRSIAACPLAFGEVGVKERVKTMMNYKKPAFWIVIAAVALCIVVAVCFLTDPKDYGPKVGNPKMLEFPGVEWFVTPEEFKEALNITEDQIVNEGITLEREDVANDYDRYDLYVTDLTLYGRDVSYALFQFRRDPGYDFAFNQAIVMFAEDTDMVKFRDELEEIYGAGSQEPYRFYLYSNNEKQYHNTELRLEQNLKYFSQNDRFLEGLDGNPYQDALSDPDYMVHHWATENGCSVIPAEVVEWFKDAMQQPWNANNSVLQDDEVLMEMLDQMPWVSMTISNRCMPAIRRDAEGIEDESAALYTNNYIEFNADFLANYLYEARKAAVDDPSLLEFPGLKWGMTVEEVKSALNITQQQILRDEQYEYPPDVGNADERWDLYVKDLQIFGHKVNMAGFEFVRISDDDPNNAAVAGNTGGAFALWHIQVFLDEETDMEKLEQELTMAYGQGVGGVYNYIDWSTGRPYESSTPANSILSNYAKRAAKDSIFYGVMDDPAYREQMWVCSDASVISDTTRTRIAQIVGENGYCEEEIHGWLNQFPWITLRFTNTTHWGILKEAGELDVEYAEYLTNNYLEYRAMAYVVTAQRAAMDAAE